MNAFDRALPPSDRDEVDAPKEGEKPSVFVERVIAENAAPPPKDPCVCKSRGWVCQHEPPYEQRLEKLWAKTS